MIPLVIKKVCEDCGAVLRYVEEWEEHYRICPGPIRLRFIDEGDPVAEVSE